MPIELRCRREKPTAARAHLWKAYSKDPSHGELLHDLIRGLARDDALAKAVELALKLREVPGWQGRGAVALGVLRAAQDKPALAAEAVEAAVNIKPGFEVARISAPTVRKQLARHRLALGQPALARAALGSLDDPEARWLLSRADLQEGKPSKIVINPSGDPLTREPAQFVGRASCTPCHGAIARRQSQSHHARTFWTRAALAAVPLPDGPVSDPANSRVIHSLTRDGEAIRVETCSDGQTYRALLAYGTMAGSVASAATVRAGIISKPSPPSSPTSPLLAPSLLTVNRSSGSAGSATAPRVAPSPPLTPARSGFKPPP
jgi:hypothetical protein